VIADGSFLIPIGVILICSSYWIRSQRLPIEAVVMNSGLLVRAFDRPMFTWLRNVAFAARWARLALPYITHRSCSLACRRVHWPLYILLGLYSF